MWQFSVIYFSHIPRSVIFSWLYDRIKLTRRVCEYPVRCAAIQVYRNLTRSVNALWILFGWKNKLSTSPFHQIEMTVGLGANDDRILYGECLSAVSSEKESREAALSLEWSFFVVDKASQRRTCGVVLSTANLKSNWGSLRFPKNNRWFANTHRAVQGWPASLCRYLIDNMNEG